MAQANRGSKRHCSHCGVNFYDLDRSPIVCPKCHHDYVAHPRLPSGRPSRATAAAAVVVPLLAETAEEHFEEDEVVEHEEGDLDEGEDGDAAGAPE